MGMILLMKLENKWVIIYLELWEELNSSAKNNLETLWEQAEPITESQSGDFTKAVRERGLVGTKAQTGNVLKFIAAETRQQRKDFEQRFKPPEGFPKTRHIKA